MLRNDLQPLKVLLVRSPKTPFLEEFGKFKKADFKFFGKILPNIYAPSFKKLTFPAVSMGYINMLGILKGEVSLYH